MDGERENFPPPAPMVAARHCRCPSAGASQLPALAAQPPGPSVVSSDQLASQWYVRLAEGTCSGERLTISGGKEGESGWITPAMTRPQLDQMLEGKRCWQ